MVRRNPAVRPDIAEKGVIPLIRAAHLAVSPPIDLMTQRIRYGRVAASGFSAACSHVCCQGFQTRGRCPQSGGPETQKCRKQEAGQRRRLIKLSCAGWLPQDRGFVSGLPLSKGERHPWAAHNRREDSPPRPASSFRHQMWLLLGY
jgi:hypothetical protein